MVIDVAPPISYPPVARLRIFVGKLRQQARVEVQWLRARSRIAAEAADAVQALKAIRASLPPDRPLVGVLLAEHLGDVVAAEPVLRKIRADHPNAHIVWCVRKPFAELVKDHPEVNSVVFIDSILEADVIVRSRVLDHFADLHVVGKHCSRHGLSYRKTWGDPSVNVKNYYHKGTLLEGLSLSAGLPRLKSQPALHLSSAIRDRVDALNLPKDLIVFHSVSNEKIRNWETPKWHELLTRLQGKFPHRVAEVGLEPTLENPPANYLNLCGKLTVGETAEVIRRASLFIGIDSGPAHLANAFAVPSVVLLGKYLHFGDYMPYTGHLEENADLMIVRANGSSQDLSVDTVEARVAQVLERAKV